MKRLYAIFASFASFAFFAFLFPAHLSAQPGPGTITTFAGTGSPFFLGDGWPAVQASLYSPSSVAVDAKGNIYIADLAHYRVRRVGTDGVITTVAGTGSPGFSGDGGPAAQASLSGPSGVAVDAKGNIYIADYTGDSGRIRRVGTDGIITTVAGGAPRPLEPAGPVGDGGSAEKASLFSPRGAAMDAKGNLYIADTNNNRIRRVGTDGIITTVAGMGKNGFSGDGGPAAQASLSGPSSVTVDAGGNLYIADTNNHRIRRVGPDGIITTVPGSGPTGRGTGGFSGDGRSAAQASLSGPSSVTVDAGGNLYIADTNNHRIRRVGSDGVITTVAGSGLYGFTGDEGLATQARLASPQGVVVDANGNFYIADTNNHRIRRVGSDGVITTVAGGERGLGDGGLAVLAGLFYPSGIAVDVTGNIYIADTYNHRIRRVDTDGIIAILAGTGTRGFSGDGGPAAQASLDNPTGVAVDAKGNVYFATSNRIRRVGSDGIITTVAGTGAFGFSGDGGPATQASLNRPTGVAVDEKGNVYIADLNNNRVRRVGPNGLIITIAGMGTYDSLGDGGPAILAGLWSPSGVAVDVSGNIYIADLNINRVRRVGTDGIIITVAGSRTQGFSGDGGLATQASLFLPQGVAVDAKGNIYIADTNNHRIRRIGPDGIITTVAGAGTRGFSGDGGPAAQASLNGPRGVAVDARGNVYIVDGENNRIRWVEVEGTAGTRGPSIRLSAPSLTFDTTKVGAASRKSLTISNTGGESMSVTGITVTGADAGQFKVSPTTLGIPARQAQAVTVTFTPTSVGHKSATLSVTHNAAGSPSSVELKGVGKDTAQVAPPPGPASENDLFKSREEFETALNRTGTAKGTAFSGTYSVLFKTLRFSKECRVDFVRNNDFFVDTGAPDTTLQRVLNEGYPDADGPATVQITQNNGRIVLNSDGDGIEGAFNGWIDSDGVFQALWGTYENNRNMFIAVYNGKIQGTNIQGDFTTRLSFFTAAKVPGSCSFTAKFAGSKIRPGEASGPSITLSTSLLAFGSTRVGSASQNALMIHNTGGDTLRITGIAIEGPDTSQFRIYPIGVAIAAGRSYTVTMMFNPTSVGMKSAVLVVVHNAPGSPARVTLSGVALPATQTGPVITTFAGSGVHGFSGDGGSATQAGFGMPSGVAADAAGFVYVSDIASQRIRRVGPDGFIATFAGIGTYGFSGDGGTATQAQLASATGMAADAKGNVYVADYGNNRIRRVGPDGIITTVAGNGTEGYGGDGGPALRASLDTPTDVAVDTGGNVYIADRSNNRIRRVGSNGIITTFAGTGTFGSAGDGGPATQANLGGPSGLSVDARGNVYIADYFNFRIRRVGPDGIITTFAGTGRLAPLGDGGPATQAYLIQPNSVAVDVKGVVYIADGGNHRIRRVEGGNLTGVSGLASDFDGNGEVGFDDFFLFAPAFGQKATGANTKYDLDRDGEVGFGDFFIFAGDFGKTVKSSKTSALSPAR